MVSRLKATTQKLSSCIPLRVLLPAVNRTYTTLLAKKAYQRIPALMSVLAESFSSVQPSDLNAAIPDLGTFFLKVLEFREDISNSEDSMEVDESELATEDVVIVEESASKALVALVLKLSEATFRPLYYKLYDWAARNSQYKQRSITFYRFVDKINLLPMWSTVKEIQISVLLFTRLSIYLQAFSQHSGMPKIFVCSLCWSLSQACSCVTK